MTGQLHGRRWATVAEWCAATGEQPGTVRARIRSGQLEARDLNAGTGKKPRYRIPIRELRRRLEGGVR